MGSSNGLPIPDRTVEISAPRDGCVSVVVNQLEPRMAFQATANAWTLNPQDLA
jgi:hypothetical protein